MNLPDGRIDGTPFSPHEKAIMAILKDLSGRKGVGDELDYIDFDVMEDMFDDLVKILKEHFP